MKQSPGESRGRVSPYKGLEPFDCLSPALMDLLAVQSAKAKGTYREA